MSFSQNYSYIYQQPRLFSQEIRIILSKQRIIQKNLVHFQGFPDSINNEKLLLSHKYLGQYGIIRKIVLVSKEDKATSKKINSAYVTFQTNEQAAYCILSLDSIKIDGDMVRAFFGTTKYCNHFLNNYHCFNEENCMFLHYLAEQSDIIDENTKFGYNDHIKLAKKIIGFGTHKSKYYVFKNLSKEKTFFPNIKRIYDKENCNPKNRNHERNLSNLSNNSTSNNSLNRSNDYNKSKSSSKEKDKYLSKEMIEYENERYYNNYFNFDCFQSRNKSRFFNINSRYDLNYENNNLNYIVNNLCKRISFFYYFKNKDQLNFLKEIERYYCFNVYRRTNDNEIKLLLDNKF
jgi:hypothetical protein